MHFAYVDEVKFDPAQEPFYWLCAIAIDENDLESIEVALDDIANEYFGTPQLDPTTEFHAVQIVQGKGPYKGHELEKRVQLFTRLADVIASHSSIGRVQVRLDPSKMYRDDYHQIAFMYLVERVDLLMRRRKSRALII
jgi:hypothetical protein